METHINEAEMADGVVWAVVLWRQLYYKLIKDLGLTVWRRPVLRTLDLWHDMWDKTQRVKTQFANQEQMKSVKSWQWKHSHHCRYKAKTTVLTLFPSSQRVTMTIIDDCCSQTILQKSPTVSSFGPTTYTGNTVYRHSHADLVVIMQECWNNMITQLYLELQCTFWPPCSPAGRKQVVLTIVSIQL